jgi:hypothetical protein
MNWICSRLLAPALGAAVALTAAGCGAEAEVVARATPLEHGRYLVENVAMCMDCHTPMGPQGPDTSRHLMGGTIIFAPTVPVPDWVGVAPPIAGGFPGWTTEELVTFLQTGVNPAGSHPRPPMPHYRFNAYDAGAVA